jgi:hypothetical protein
MTKPIPDDQLANILNSRHLKRQVIPPSFTIESLLRRGKLFYNAKMEESRIRDRYYVGLALALEEACEELLPDGIIASLPLLIAGKANSNAMVARWSSRYSSLSEEVIGIDHSGRLGAKKQPVAIIVHGGGVLTPQRIKMAYFERLTQEGAAKY